MSAFKKRYGAGESSANPRFKRDDDRFDGRGGRAPARRGPDRFGADRFGSDRRGPPARGGRDSRTSGRDSRYKPRLELFNAMCAKCKKPCQVPFKPTGEKPVLCRECFSSPDASMGESRERPSRTSSYVSHASDLDRINEKLDKIMAALKIR